jgi:membrane associated rhomboid family serine protease
VIIPYGTADRPRKTTPWVNYALLLSNIAVFFYIFSRPEAQMEALVREYALFPAHWTFTTLFSCMWLHANLAHLFGNMLFLFIAGDSVEDRLGHASYLIFYLAAGLCGGFAHIATSSGATGEIPTVGASGAISGVIAAFLVFNPTTKIKFLVLFFMATFTSPAWVAVTLWVVTQVVLIKAQLAGQGSNVAVFAHAGGFMLGFVFAIVHRLFLGPKKRD